MLIAALAEESVARTRATINLASVPTSLRRVDQADRVEANVRVIRDFLHYESYYKQVSDCVLFTIDQSGGAGTYCGNVKCSAHEKCDLDKSTKRQKCVRA